MQLNSDSEEIISLLGQQESTISRLYRGFSYIFENNDFWQKLANQENIHMQWIMSLKASEEASINKERFNIEAIKEMIDYENKLIQKQSELTLKQALGTALDIENSLLENKFFTVFDTDSDSLKKVLTDLAKDTDNHKFMLQDELEKYK